MYLSYGLSSLPRAKWSCAGRVARCWISTTLEIGPSSLFLRDEGRLLLELRLFCLKCLIQHKSNTSCSASITSASSQFSSSLGRCCSNCSPIVRSYWLFVGRRSSLQGQIEASTSLCWNHASWSPFTKRWKKTRTSRWPHHLNLAWLKTKNGAKTRVQGFHGESVGLPKSWCFLCARIGFHPIFQQKMLDADRET